MYGGSKGRCVEIILGGPSTIVPSISYIGPYRFIVMNDSNYFQGMVYGLIFPLLVMVCGILAPNATLIRFEQWFGCDVTHKRNRNYLDKRHVPT